MFPLISCSLRITTPSVFCAGSRSKNERNKEQKHITKTWPSFTTSALYYVSLEEHKTLQSSMCIFRTEFLVEMVNQRQKGENWKIQGPYTISGTAINGLQGLFSKMKQTSLQ